MLMVFAEEARAMADSGPVHRPADDGLRVPACRARLAALFLVGVSAIAMPRVSDAQTPPATVPCTSEQFQLDPPKAARPQPWLEWAYQGISGNPFRDKVRYRLNDILVIHVVGDCQARVRAALDISGSAPVAVLHLNEIPMPLSVWGDERTLYVALERNPRVEASRTAWDRFLGAESYPDFDVRIGIAVKGDPIVPVAIPPAPLQPAAGSDAARPAERIMTFGVASADRVFPTIAVCLLSFVGLLVWLGWTTALRDATGLYSLARTQMAFWGLLMLVAFSGIAFVTRTLEPVPAQMFLLGGISGVTGVGAMIVDAFKPRTKELRGRPPHPFHGVRSFIRELCSDDRGLSFPRLQAVLWTAVLGIIFMFTVSRTMTMPTFDQNLLVLLGITGATYVGAKASETKETPKGGA